MSKRTDAPDPRIAQAVTMAEQGSSLSDIAAVLGGVSTRTASRLVKAGGGSVRIPGGGKIGKKPKYLSRVLALHHLEKSVGEIEEEIGDLHSSTIAEWLRAEGLTPIYRGDVRLPQEIADHPAKEGALKRYLAGESAPAVSKDLGLNSRTVEWWAKQAGIWGQGGIEKRHREQGQKAVEQYRAGKTLSEIVAGSSLDYYQVRQALDEAGALPYTDKEMPDVFCPCGKKTGSPNRKYCSPECRKQHGRKRQKDPSKWIIFECQNCGKTVEARKGLNYQKYCSNACAQKHTKVKRHYGVDGLEIVFDSGYEVLFWGLCVFNKVPIERYDREKGVEWRPGLWYAPDFYMPTLNFAVEVKGVLDDEDPERWDAFRQEVGSLIVLTEAKLRQMINGKGDMLKTMLT
jgi:transposase